MHNGTVYGVILNDREENEGLKDAFEVTPYRVAPIAPVLYVKPRNCRISNGGEVGLPVSTQVSVGATLALWFSRDATRVSVQDAMGFVGGASVAMDLSLPHADYYRPAIVERCRDGFLPLGPIGQLPADYEATQIETLVDGAIIHSWSLARLARNIPELIAAVTEFMTLQAGDTLLVGLPGDAPKVSAGNVVEARATGLPSVWAVLGTEKDA